jgi:predicted acyltransferase
LDQGFDTINNSQDKEGTLIMSPSDRLVSLDVFRGITIAGMVLVNNPGTWSSIYWPLEHAQWNGWTPTDLVFPFFLFIVGVSITLAFARRVEEGAVQRALYLKVVKRSAIIFGLGFLLNLIPNFDFATVRIPGVLQRIAVCYLITSLIFLKTKVRTQFVIALVLLVGYWLLMTRVAAPGFAAGDLSKEGSLASYIDRVVFGAHVWRQAKVYDPEGLLSTIPAVATTLFGVLTGHWLRSERTRWDKVAAMFVAGAAGVALGWAWNSFFPINKALWTSSYVLFTAGLALQLLALCYWLIDINGFRRWAWPFEVFGVNALALFVGSALMVKLMALIKIPQSDGTRIASQGWIFRNLFLTWASPINASLFYAIAFILLWLFLMWLLYRKGIIIKV